MRVWLDRLMKNKPLTALIPPFVDTNVTQKKNIKERKNKNKNNTIKKKKQNAKHTVRKKIRKLKDGRIEDYVKTPQMEQPDDGEDQHDSLYGLNYTSKSDQVVRLWFTNPCGIGINSRTSKSYASFKFLKDKSKTDYLGLAETNVNWRLLNPSSSLYSRIKNHWKDFRSITCNNVTEQMGKCQRGGNCSFAVGQLSHRFHSSGKDERKLGRWLWMQFQGKNQHFTRVYTAYRPGTKPQGSKLTTVYDQQDRYIRKKKLNTDPRTLFDKDLHKEIEAQITKGTQIVIMIDANENVECGIFQQMMNTLHLRNVFTRYCRDKMPPTHHSGSKPISTIFCSESLMISQAGILQKGIGFQADHRNMYVDFTVNSFLGAHMFKVATPSMKKLQLNDCRIYKRFIKEVKNHCKATGTLVKAAKLFQQSQNESTLNNNLQQMEIIDDQIGRAIAHGLSKCRKLRTGNIPYSETLSKLWNEKRLWLLILKKKVGQRISNRTIRRLAKSRRIDHPMQLPIMEVKERLKQAEVKYKRFIPQAWTERKHFYEELAAINAVEQNTTKENMLKRIMNVESARLQSRHMKRYFPKTSAIKSVDRVSYTNKGINLETNDPKTMVREIQSETKTKYTSCHDTPLMQPKNHSLLGNFANTTFASELMDGTSTLENSDEWTLRMLDSIRSDENIPKQSVLMTETEVEDVWKSTKEHKASSMSNRYNAVYKSLCKDKELLKLLTHSMNIPFLLGRPYKRWSKFLDIMSFKKPNSIHVSTLRTIIISEADWNASGKIYITRRMMAQAEHMKLLPHEHYGGRKGKKAIDGALTKRLILDNSRMMRKPMAIVSTDAANCYDRMAHKFIAMACMQWGVPARVIRALLEPLHHAQHYTRTAYGDSDTFFTGDNLQGAGQGNTGAAPYWTCVSTHMIQILKQEVLHATYLSPITKKEIILALIAFVDDTELFITDPNDDSSALIQRAEDAINVWRSVLQVTGGAMRPSKCAWTIMHYDYKGNLLPVSKVDEDVSIPNAEGAWTALEKYDVHEPRKYLGVDQCTNGNDGPQYEILEGKVTQWNSLMQKSRMSHYGNLQATLTKIYKSITYPLPTLTLTPLQCETLGNKLFTATLPKCGISSKFPIVHRHLPKRYQGLGLPHLYLEQESKKIQELLIQSTGNSPCWAQLKLSLEIVQAEIGACHIIYNLPYEKLSSLVEPSWVKSQWKFLAQHDIQIQGWKVTHQMQREHDVPIMETFAKSNLIDIPTIAILNKCRKYLRVITLADITNGYGTHILENMLKGTLEPQSNPSLNSQQGRPAHKPSVKEWIVWKQSLTEIFMDGNYTGKLTNPLGLWIAPDIYKHHEWYYNPLYTYIYKKVRGNLYRIYKPTSRAGVSTRAQTSIYRVCAIQTLTDAVIKGLYPAKVSSMGTSVNQVSFEGWAKVKDSSKPSGGVTTSNLYEAALKYNTPQWYYSQITHALQEIKHEEIEKVMTHQTLRIVADGSYEDNISASATIIETLDTSNRIIIPSPVPANGSSWRMNDPYRAELHGLLVGIHTLHLMEAITGRKINAIFSCDNDRALEVTATYTYINSHTKHMDLVQSIIHMRAQLKSTISFEKVLGHADTKKGVPYQNLTRVEQLNVQCDIIAKMARKTFRPAYPSEMFYQGEQLSAWIGPNKIYTDLTSAIQTHFLNKLAENELCKKYSWTTSEFHQVAWSSVAKSSTLMSPSTNHFVSKYVTRFLPIGRNMVKRSHWQHDYCPRCKTCQEDTHHLLLCHHPSCITTFKTSMNDIDLWMTRQHTPDQLRAEIIFYINKWRLQEPCLSSPSLTPPMQAQLRFGWHHFIEGRPITGFITYMDATYKRQGSKKTGAKWLSTLIQKLWTLLHRKQWEDRNSHVHNLHEESESSRETENLRSEINTLYSSELIDNLLVRDQHLLEMPLEELLTYPNAHLRAWIEEFKVATSERDSIFLPSLQRQSALLRGWMNRRHHPPDEEPDPKRVRKEE